MHGHGRHIFLRGTPDARHRLLPGLSAVLESHDTSANRIYRTPAPFYAETLRIADSDTVTGCRLMGFQCILSGLVWLWISI